MFNLYLYHLRSIFALVVFSWVRVRETLISCSAQNLQNQCFLAEDWLGRAAGHWTQTTLELTPIMLSPQQRARLFLTVAGSYYVTHFTLLTPDVCNVVFTDPWPGVSLSAVTSGEAPVHNWLLTTETSAALSASPALRGSQPRHGRPRLRQLSPTIILPSVSE